eukprot:TRINITY_DN7766_c0_g1_i1.p1 TRINITY_DN7766_c0_g1~~TRINITY_DN7766_c0_g1_i1.p1  ORF type:complete len:314 (+),score=20.01 TRINITY_DN7766_c0_g1_i1:46-987(+)
MTAGYQRQNGFTRRPHKLQLLSYICILGELGVFFALIFPRLYRLRIPAVLLFGVSFILTFIFWLASACIDPTDESSIREKNARIGKGHFEDQGMRFYCDVCDTHVNDDSKHCRQCNRCVRGFDHHCKWINNCIGARNYKVFVALIIAVLAMQFTFVSFGLVSITGTVETKGDIAITALIAFSTLSAGIFGIMDLNLVLFHLYLIRRGKTTYEFILDRRAQSRNRVVPEESRRRSEQSEANEGGDDIITLRVPGAPEEQQIERRSVQSQITGNSCDSPESRANASTGRSGGGNQTSEGHLQLNRMTDVSFISLL